MKNYYEERGERKRTCEINRIVKGCTGVRRTTGQHPGGIIVLPLGEEIDSFTPVQHPANDMTTDIITTHFDYHSIDHNLLKLDILGHDDPTMIRMLQDVRSVRLVFRSLEPISLSRCLWIPNRRAFQIWSAFPVCPMEQTYGLEMHRP